MSTIRSTLKKVQKKYGMNIGGIGMDLPELPRLPLGILPFDIASGGGIPMNKMTIVHGEESSGKTNFALSAIASFQRWYPDKTCVFVDVEHATPTNWMTKMGVDVKKLAPIRPTHGEAVVDIVNEMLYADDCGLLVIDSIPAIVTLPELEKDSGDRTPGMAGKIMAKLVRKCTAALGDAERNGRIPTMIWVNQTRHKIGMVFGNPETIPGGEGQKFMTFMRVRMSAKNVVDKTVNPSMPVMKSAKGVILKWKTPICTTHFGYDMAMLPHKGLVVGECADWGTMKKYLSAFKIVVKDGNQLVYTPTGEMFPNQDKLWQYLREHRDEIRDMVVAKLKADPEAAKDAEEES